MTAHTFVPLFVIGAGFVLFLIYFSQLQLRKRNYGQIAAELGAEYQPQSVFKTGKISGACDHRKYTVENRTGFHGSMWTAIEMQCANNGIPLHIHGAFFKDFPNWKYAFTEGDRTERVFAANVTVQGAGVPLDEKYKIEVQGLFQEFAIADGAFLKRGRIRIEQDKLSFVVHGVVKKLEVIQEALSLLARLANRIESAPITQYPRSAQQRISHGRLGDTQDTSY
jgi:hypothetical protein